MKNFLFTLVLLLTVSEDIQILKAQQVAYDWAYSISGTVINNNGTNGGSSITTDNQGNVYITGYFKGTADFDPSAATANLTSYGNYDIFLAKFDSTGNYQWAKNMGGPHADLGKSVATDSSGNIFITGTFQFTADFDPSVGIANLSSSATLVGDGFLAKYDSAGNYLWARGISSTVQSIGLSVSIDNIGNAYLTGFFNDTSVFNSSGSQDTLTSIGYRDVFIAKYTPSGNLLWTKQIGGTGSDVSRFITLDSNNNIYITGDFEGSVDFDPSAATNIRTALVVTDIFLAKYDSAGNHLWAISMGGSSSTAEGGTSISIDGSENVYFCGFYSGVGDFDPSSGTAILTSAGGVEIFLAKYDSAGNYLWARNMGGSGNDLALSVCVDSANAPIVTGQFRSIADFDPSTDTANLYSAGFSDIFLAKYDSVGNYMWAKSLVGSGYDYANSLTIDNKGATYIIGEFDGTTDMDPSGNTANLTNNSLQSILFARYIPCTVTSTVDSIIACDSLTWIDGNTYSSNNDSAFITFTNAAGCDSLRILNLTIKNSTSFTQVISACEDYTWIDGLTYSSSNNTATYLLPNSAGCDSLVSLDLTINNTDSTTDSVTACKNYTWIDGITYTSNNNSATHLLANANGCDSLVTLDLTIHAPDTSVTVSQFNLTANNGLATYNWLDCNNGFATIPGELSQSFLATSDGSYAVEVTENGCIDTSACYTITGTTINETNGEDNTFKISPNPTSGSVTIYFTRPQSHISISVLNVWGELLITKDFRNITQEEILLPPSAGLYFIKTENEYGITVKRVILVN